MKRRKRAEARARERTPGASPGTLAIDASAQKPTIQLMAYGPDALVEETIHDPTELSRFLEEYPVTWINVNGLGDEATLRELGKVFDLHPLALEDVVNTTQRPKVEEYGKQLFIVVTMPIGEGSHETEQLSLFLGKNYVLTFQEHEGDCLEPVRTRARRGRPRLRNSGPDYLTYALLDAVVDAFFPVLDAFGDRLAELEAEILTDPRDDVLPRLHDLKRTLEPGRRVAAAFRNVFAELHRDESPFIAEATRVYLRDCHDHSVQLLETVENHREMGSGLMDLYHSSLSNRMNDVMKVLTVTATIFIPLTFIAGIYGMNFDPDRSPLNMPELGWYWGYPFAMTLMGIVALVMVILFHRKGWIGSPRRIDKDRPGEPR